MGKKKRNKGYFGDAQDNAIGLAGLGLTTGVGAGIASHAPAGTPSLTQGFGTIASFAPIGITASMGGGLIKRVRKLNKKRRKR